MLHRSCMAVMVFLRKAKWSKILDKCRYWPLGKVTKVHVNFTDSNLMLVLEEKSGGGFTKAIRSIPWETLMSNPSNRCGDILVGLVKSEIWQLESQGITKIIRIQPLDIVNVCAWYFSQDRSGETTDHMAKSCLRRESTYWEAVRDGHVPRAAQVEAVSLCSWIEYGVQASLTIQECVDDTGSVHLNLRGDYEFPIL